MQSFARLFFAVILLALLSPAAVQAAKYPQGGKVVHSRLLPVIAHRLSPPFHGNHVYSRRTGR